MLRGSDGLTRNIGKKYWQNPNLTQATRETTIVNSCKDKTISPFLIYSLKVQVNETPSANMHWKHQ